MQDSAQPAAGVIFDLDGTLVDTLDDITASLNVAVVGTGLSPLSAAHVRTLVGDGLPVLMQRATGVSDKAALRQLIESFREHYLAHLLDRSRLYPGIAGVLDRLTEARCPLAVLSNKPHDATQQICQKLLAPWPFIECLGADPARPKKPDPQAALWLADRLRRPPADVFFVGDSAVDVQTAREAGMQPIGVSWGFRDVAELRTAGADVIVDHPTAIPDFVLRATPS